MKLLLASLLLIGCATSRADEVYLKLGAGYKLDELQIYFTDTQTKFDDPVSARIELGVQRDAWTIGVAHYSQWLTGRPFNSRSEYYKTELFIDYKFSWGM